MLLAVVQGRDLDHANDEMRNKKEYHSQTDISDFSGWDESNSCLCQNKPSPLQSFLEWVLCWPMDSFGMRLFRKEKGFLLILVVSLGLVTFARNASSLVLSNTGRWQDKQAPLDGIHVGGTQTNSILSTRMEVLPNARSAMKATNPHDPSTLSDTMTIPSVSCKRWVVVLSQDDDDDDDLEIQNMKRKSSSHEELCVVVVVVVALEGKQHKKTPNKDTGVWMKFMNRQVIADNSNNSSSSQIHILTPIYSNIRSRDHNRRNSESLILSPVERFIESALSSSCRNQQQEICLKNVGYMYALHQGAHEIVDLPLSAPLSFLSSSWDAFLGEAALETLNQVQLPLVTSNDPPLFDSWWQHPASTNTSIAIAHEIPSLNTSHHHLAIIHGYGGNENDSFFSETTETADSVPLLLSLETKDKPFLIPPRQFTSMTPHGPSLFTASSLWSLFLPQTFHGFDESTGQRVSICAVDMARNLISQRLFHDLDLQVVIVPYNNRSLAEVDVENYPKTAPARQLRRSKVNSEETVSRSCSESGLDIHFRAQLVQFLHEWNAPATRTTVHERLEDLYVAMHQHGMISEQDLSSMKLWLAALAELHYSFPPVKRYRHDNVLLSGQFNYADNEHILDYAAFWVQKWREVFRHVQVRGPFSPDQLSQLQQRGIDAFPLPSDKGFYSPITNLAESLEYAQHNMTGIEGVIYLHDDALLNMTQLLGGNSLLTPFPVQDIIGTSLWFFPASYMDARQFFPAENEEERDSHHVNNNNSSTNRNLPSLDSVPGMDDPITRQQAMKAMFRISQHNGKFQTPLGLTFAANESGQLLASLVRWSWYRRCVGPVQNMFQDMMLHQEQHSHEPLSTSTEEQPLSSGQRQRQNSSYHPFLDRHDGNLYVPSPTQSDFLFVPVKYATSFGKAAKLVVRHNVFLECGLPLIVQMLRQEHDEKEQQGLQKDNEPSSSSSLLPPPLSQRESNQVTVRTIDLCTSWSGNMRQPEWIFKCIHEPEKTEWKKPGKTFGMFHPWKLAVAGFASWGEFFNLIIFP